MDATLAACLEAYAQEGKDTVERIMAATAVDKGYLMVFDAAGARLTASGYELTQKASVQGRLDLDVYDMEHRCWYHYPNCAQRELWSRHITDHFTVAGQRKYHLIC